MGQISQSILRTLATYFVVLIVMRIMGKREIGQLSSFDLVVALIIAELAAIPVGETELPFFRGIVPIITITTAQILLSFLCLKIDWLREVVYGHPTVLIKNGKILEREMLKSRYNLEDLLTQLREKNFPNVADVEFAILENSGDLTVIPKSQKRPLTPEDLGLSTIYEGLCLPLIVDGKIKRGNLEQTGLGEGWLLREIRARGAQSFNDVFFASRDTAGTLYVDLRE